MLETLYKHAEEKTGRPVANILKVHSLKPNILKGHVELHEAIMFKECELSGTQKEMIGVVVSAANECLDCVEHHREALNQVTVDEALMKQIAKDYMKADIEEVDKAICQYAETLTKTPYKMTKATIDHFKELGLSDTAILEINQVTAYFNYMNRVVQGLGVEL